jgi:vancomycin permeability regulator SanA
MRFRTKAIAAVIGFALLACVAVANGTVLFGGRAQGVKNLDCALVLGAGVRDDGTPSDVLRDRLDIALDLFRRGRVQRILVSGDHREASYDEPNAMRRYLEANGVPRGAIFMDHAGFDTYSSVWRAKNVFGANRIIVVTQDFHLPRALYVARSLGMAAEGASADRRLYRGIAWLHAREVISRTKAFVDIAVARRPHHEGPPIDLRGDGRVTAG